MIISSNKKGYRKCILLAWQFPHSLSNHMIMYLLWVKKKLGCRCRQLWWGKHGWFWYTSSKLKSICLSKISYCLSLVWSTCLPTHIKHLIWRNFPTYSWSYVGRSGSCGHCVCLAIAYELFSAFGGIVSPCNDGWNICELDTFHFDQARMIMVLLLGYYAQTIVQVWK